MMRSRPTRIGAALREATAIAERRRRLVRTALLGLAGALVVAATLLLLVAVW
jgi:hypothetical protein